MTAYVDRFATLYASELDAVFDVTGFPATIVDTGGGCLNIECDGGDRPNVHGERLTLCVTNCWDGGLADLERGEVPNLWYVTLRDEDMDILATGEDVDLGTAVRDAYAQLRAIDAAVDAYARVAREQILEDVDNGTVPRDVASFSALHAYVDANMYADDELQALEVLAGDEENGYRRIELTNRATDRVDVWIRSGMPRD